MVDRTRTDTATTHTADGDEAPEGDDRFQGLLVANRYQIERRIGAGGMGRVYAARDLQLGRKVAVKVVAPRADSEAAQDRLAREARAMATLRHPNVVTIYDIVAVGRKLLLVMELVDGGTLADWLRASPRPWRRVVEMFAQAARGLASAHAAGFVHCDFKAENVLVDGEGAVRVTDFGVTRWSDDDPAGSESGAPAGSDEEVVGTAGYIAPEVLQQKPVGPPADQFSFCVALYRALYDQRPFGVGGDRLLTETLGLPRPPPSGRAPRRLARIVLRGLAAEPAARWPTMVALMTALEQVLRRRRRVLVAIAPLAVILGGVGAVLGARRVAPGTAGWSPVLIGANSPDTIGMTISGDGTVLAHARSTEVVVEPRTGGERRHVRLPPNQGAVSHLRLSQHGETVFVLLFPASGDGTLWALDATGSGPSPYRLAPPDFAPELKIQGRWFDVSADGKLLVIATTEDDPLPRLVQIDGHEARTLRRTAPDERLMVPASSPDGNRIALVKIVGHETRLELIDVAEGTSTSHRLGDLSACDWSGPTELLCEERRHDRSVLVELSLTPALEVAQARDRYVAPRYENAVSPRCTTAGFFFGTRSQSERLVALDLGRPEAAPAILSTDSLTDLPAAGWTSKNDLIFGADVGGRLQIMARHPDGSIDVVEPGPSAEVPLVVLGDSLIFGRFPDGEQSIPRVDYRFTREYPREGELFRREPDGTVVPLGPTHGFVGVVCAGDRTRPCLLLELEGDDVQAFAWDPETGARGAPASHWLRQERIGPALSPDGRTLALVAVEGTQSHGVELVDLVNGQRRRWDFLSSAFRSLAWQPDGALLAVGFVRTWFAVARLSEGHEPEVLFSRAGQWPLEPRVRPDGKEVVFPVVDTLNKYWWVAR